MHNVLAAVGLILLLWWLISVTGRRRKEPRAGVASTGHPSFNQPGHYDPAIEYPMAVHGESHRNTDGVSRQKIILRYCRPGDPVRLIPEPHNPVDPDAVAVFHEDGQIGYAPAHQAGRLKREIEEGRFRGAWILSINGGDEGRESVGVTLRVARALPKKRKPKAPPKKSV